MNSVTRFSSRVENYAKYRPGYPREILNPLRDKCGLTPASIVADIGSGTGLLTKLFLENGNTVFAVEPNALMRQKAEPAFKHVQSFKSVNGNAEDTTLPAASVDFIVAGQAFHWFDPIRARREFVRILKPQGWVMLVWNARRLDSTPFLREYEDLLLRYSPDYALVRHENAEENLAAFFSPQPMSRATFPNVQRLDFESLKGRLCSSSYAPEASSPVFETMMTGLRRIFDRHNDHGLVDVTYDTRMFYGQL